MLRITRVQNNRTIDLKLEGKLLADWTGEVQGQLPHDKAALGEVRLDLMHVTFADAAGIALLRDLMKNGATIGACSSFVAELLNARKS